MTPAERRQLRIFQQPGASIAVGREIHAKMARKGWLARRDSGKRGWRYFITETGIEAMKGKK